MCFLVYWFFPALIQKAFTAILWELGGAQVSALSDDEFGVALGPIVSWRKRPEIDDSNCALA